MRYSLELRPWTFILIPALGLVAAACSNAEGGLAYRGPESDDASTVGQVVEIFDPEAYLDDGPAEGGGGIPRDAKLSTNETGLMKVAFPRTDAECQIFHRTEITVVSDDQRLLRHDDGNMTCLVPQSPSGEVAVQEYGRYINPVTDSIYRVGINDKGSGVHVLYGQVETTNILTGETEVVDAGKTRGWGGDGKTNPKWKIPPLSGAEKAAELKAFGDRLPASDT